MRRSRRAIVSIILSGAVAACSGAAPQGGKANTPRAAQGEQLLPEQRLERAIERLATSRYAEAESDLRAVARGPETSRAWLAISELELITGRYEQAVASSRNIPNTQEDRYLRAAVVRAEALRRQGKLEQAEAELRVVEPNPNARAARLLLGELLLDRGRRDLAEPVLMTLIEDYNSDRITSEQGAELALVGRAAHLLRSPQDANDAFNEAEQASPGDVRTLLWRAELFLDKYDPGHAEEVINEVLEQAPNHPEANVWLAHVKLAQALDFDEAERLANKALHVNPNFGPAYFVLAGVALRDMEIALADERIDAGLRVNTRDLDLLSLRATARFLAEDSAGFERVKRDILTRSPGFTRFYQVVGEYADWEHRYDEIVSMMREAVQLDPEDAKAHAQLGLNQIRAGNDQEGVQALTRAFELDPFNVRVFNTLNLYEKIIPKNYVEVERPPFRIRYHKDEREILDRYVPELLTRAWQKMIRAYGFTPSTPVGIELYAERQNFAVRTSGLPQTAIQGVCFGRTLAAMSPKQEQFNVGMTLWHELAHVFHIQRSRSRVPRWFTEGLAEYETLIERPEWAREHDPDLYEALRSGRLPRLGSMSRAFSRAEELSDVAMAYYASSQILVMLAEKYGVEKLSQMLALWGQGKSTSEVMRTALGATAEQLDQQFRAFLKQRFTRYERQFVPRTRVGSVAKTAELAKADPKSATKLTDHAIALSRAGQQEPAERVAARALSLDPKNADARWINADIFLRRGDVKRGAPLLQSLVQDGFDGYSVQMALAVVAESKQDVAAGRAALEAAMRFDPTQSEPVQRMAILAAREKNGDQELVYLRRLAELEQHDPGIYRRLLQLLLERRLFAEAVRVGESAVFADMEHLETHVMYAEALLAERHVDRARFELESALVCEGSPEDLADVWARLAELEQSQGDRKKATAHARQAKKLDPQNARLKALNL